MAIQTIEVKQLSKSPLNARQTNSKAACEELKASLLAHGLMQNLVVVPAKKGRHHVIAGARRLEALQALIAEGKLPADHAVPCQVATAGQAREMSLAENAVRLAMHPADEFEAFAALIDAGQTASQVAERFGTAEKHVLQRLKLGRVAPELLAAYRAEEIDLECLQAYAVTDDRKRQMDLYRSLHGWQRTSARHIRECLTEQMTDADGKLAKFVGLAAYEAAGGGTKADLFGEDVFLEDTALLHRLAGEKLEAEAEKLRADGWGWVEVDFECGYGTLSKFGRIPPIPLDAPAELLAELEAAKAAEREIEDAIDATDDEDELEKLWERSEEAERKREAIEDKLEAYTVFDPEQKKLAGCFVAIGHDGRLSVERGLVKPEDKKQVAKARPDGDEPEEAAPAKPAMPDSLRRDLEAYRTQVAQVALAENPAIAFDLLVMTAARYALQSRPIFDGPDVHFRQSHPIPSGGEKTDAAERLEAIKEALPLGWMREKAEAAQLAAFQRLAEADKHRILAYCTAMTLRPKLSPAAGKQQTAYDAALAQATANVAAYWRPTAANFLGRLKSGQLLDIGREIFGEKWATHRAKWKKSELVSKLDTDFAKPEGVVERYKAFGETYPEETAERLKSWLPAGMASGAPASDAEKKAA